MEVGIVLRPRRARGITLVELIGSIAVIIVSVGLLAPGWSSLLEGNRITTAANGLLTDLRFARNTAVTRTTFVTLCPSTDLQDCSGDHRGWQDGYIVFVDRDGDRRRTETEPLLRVQDRRARGPAIHSTSARPAVRFRSDGAAWGTNTTFSICGDAAASNNRAVVLYGSGRARVDRVAPGPRPVRCG